MPPSQFHPKLGCRNRNFTLNWGVGIVILPNSGVSESELGKKIPVGIVPSIGGVRIKNGMSQYISETKTPLVVRLTPTPAAYTIIYMF